MEILLYLFLEVDPLPNYQNSTIAGNVFSFWELQSQKIVKHLIKIRTTSLYILILPLSTYHT